MMIDHKDFFDEMSKDDRYENKIRYNNGKVSICFHHNLKLKIFNNKVFINGQRYGVFDQDFENYLLNPLVNDEIVLFEYKKKRIFFGYFKIANKEKCDIQKKLSNKKINRILTRDNVYFRGQYEKIYNPYTTKT